MVSTFNARDAANYERSMGRWSRRLAPGFLAFADIGAAASVLDVGCGTGSLLFTLAANTAHTRITGIDAVLFTHAHADHISGIDDIRILNRIANRPLEAFATPRTLEEISRRFAYAFKPWDPPHFFRPVLVGAPVEPGDTLETAGLTVQLFNQNHGKIDTLGLRIGAFGYSTDVVKLDETAMETLAGVDTWVVDCFLRGETHWTHANLACVLAWVERLRPRRTVLTHMGTGMDWAWMAANLPEGVEAAYDGMVLTV
jgi:phosphoribosyl 1,2-cyclic phosphate phosphodiesterase